MFYIYMMLQFILSFESHVTLCFTDLVRAQVMSHLKMRLQIIIILVINILMLVPTQMACQVLPG